MVRLWVAVVALGAVLGACTDGDGGAAPTPTPPSPSPSPTELPAGWTLCSNTAVGYAIGHPSDWFTASTTAENECRWFDRREFTLREGTEGPTTDLVALPLDRDFEEQLRLLGAGPDERLVAQTDMTIAGHRAVRFEIVQEGEGFFPQGTRFYGYLIDGGEVALLVETIHTGAEDDYEDNRPIVDQAAATVRFD